MLEGTGAGGCSCSEGGGEGVQRGPRESRYCEGKSSEENVSFTGSFTIASRALGPRRAVSDVGKPLLDPRTWWCTATAELGMPY